MRGWRRLWPAAAQPKLISSGVSVVDGAEFWVGDRLEYAIVAGTSVGQVKVGFTWYGLTLPVTCEIELLSPKPAPESLDAFGSVVQASPDEIEAQTRQVVAMLDRQIEAMKAQHEDLVTRGEISIALVRDLTRMLATIPVDDAATRQAAVAMIPDLAEKTFAIRDKS